MDVSSKPKHARFASVKEAVADNLQKDTIIRTVAIQSLYPAHLKYIGLSGQEYEWVNAGTVVLVNEEDAPELLAKVIGTKGCCGVRSDGNVLFQKL